MRKHHIEAIARAFQQTRATGRHESQWFIDVQAIARVLACFNPRFDSARFMRACGAETCLKAIPTCARYDLTHTGRRAI